MDLIQTKKWINMEEIDLIAEFSARAANGEPDLNWNKVLEKINRERSIAEVPNLRQRCFVSIMKAGGASDGRIRGWNKRKYLKSIGFKEQEQQTEFQRKLQEGIKKLFPQNETDTQKISEPESSAEAEEMSKLSNDALVLLKFFINNSVDRKINVSAAKKFFGIGMKRIQEAEDELLNLQIIRCEGTSHKKGSRYMLCLDNEMIWQMYPQTKGVCLANEIVTSKKNGYIKSSKKAEEKKDVEKDSFDPRNKLQDAIVLLRNNSNNGISYSDCEQFKEILPDGNWNQFHSIQKMLEELDILIRVGVNGNQWFFQDPEENMSVHNDPNMNNKVVEPEVIKESNVQIVPVSEENSKASCLPKDAATITVNCYRKDVKYHIIKSGNGYVIDIM